MFKRLTHEEKQLKAERKAVENDIQNKAFGTAFTACILALVLALIFLSKITAALGKGGDNFGGRFVVIFGVPGCVFWIVLFLAWQYFSHRENTRFQKRLAQRAENKRRAEEEAKQAQQVLIKQREQAMLEEQRASEAARAALRQKQTHQANREFILKKLNTVHNYIGLYDPVMAESAVDKQKISTALSEIMLRLTYEERAALITEDADIRGMVVALKECLQTKGLNIPEATQMFATLPH